MSNEQIVTKKFNELDNWLGIMDIDPPKTAKEKQAMYERLMAILELMFEKPYPGKTSIQRDMQKIISA
ncbi:MAG: hypothetical protein ACYCQJ_01535 [Nitrososphaerales archaeon]